MPETAYKETYEPEEITYRMPLLRSEINIMRRNVDSLNNDVAEIKRDVGVLKSDVADLKRNVSEGRLEQEAIKSVNSGKLGLNLKAIFALSVLALTALKSVLMTCTSLKINGSLSWDS